MCEFSDTTSFRGYNTCYANEELVTDARLISSGRKSWLRNELSKKGFYFVSNFVCIYCD